MNPAAPVRHCGKCTSEACPGGERWGESGERRRLGSGWGVGRIPVTTPERHARPLSTSRSEPPWGHPRETRRYRDLVGQFFTDYNLLAAGSVLVALPTILVFLLLQRHFVAGLTLGSTKG